MKVFIPDKNLPSISQKSNNICNLLNTYCVLGTTFDSLISTWSCFIMNWKLKEIKHHPQFHSQSKGRAEIQTQKRSNSKAFILKKILDLDQGLVNCLHISKPFWHSHLILFFTAQGRRGRFFFLPETGHRLSLTSCSFPANIPLPSLSLGLLPNRWTSKLFHRKRGEERINATDWMELNWRHQFSYSASEQGSLHLHSCHEDWKRCRLLKLGATEELP